MPNAAILPFPKKGTVQPGRTPTPRDPSDATADRFDRASHWTFGVLLTAAGLLELAVLLHRA